MKKMMQAQLDYFGGDHPAPVQAIALHVVGKGVNPSIPGFNRRPPSFDSILGVHNPKRPWGSFEFFGMLSHEHMHNWFPNVLRSDLGPWFMEGLNDYVSYGIMHDSGLHRTNQRHAQQMVPCDGPINLVDEVSAQPRNPLLVEFRRLSDACEMA